MQELTERSVSGCASGCTQTQFTLTEQFSLNATNVIKQKISEWSRLYCLGHREQNLVLYGRALQSLHKSFV